MIGKIIAATILCIIVLTQWVIGMRNSVKKGLGCFGIVTFTVYTAILLLLFYLADMFKF